MGREVGEVGPPQQPFAHERVIDVARRRANAWRAVREPGCPVGGREEARSSEALAQTPRSIRSNPDVPGDRHERAEAVGRTRRSWRTRRQSATVAIGREIDAHRARKDVLAGTERRRARLITSDDGLVPDRKST